MHTFHRGYRDAQTTKNGNGIGNCLKVKSCGKYKQSENLFCQLIADERVNDVHFSSKIHFHVWISWN